MSPRWRVTVDSDFGFLASAPQSEAKARELLGKIDTEDPVEIRLERLKNGRWVVVEVHFRPPRCWA